MYTVAVWQQHKRGYSEAPPYHPPEIYPELGFCKGVAADPSNQTYSSVRNLFQLLAYDAARCGTAGWNPLAWLVKPGHTVFIKPNLIAERHARNGDWNCITTHGSVIRAVVDYIYLALHGRGRILVADAPQTDSDIRVLRQRIGIDAIQEFYRRRFNFDIEFLDLREEYWKSQDGIVTKKYRLAGDPLGTVRVNLAKDSYFAEIDDLQRRYYGAFYDVGKTNRHHSNGVHEYLIARSALQADVFISLPKLKTHKKVGVTLNLKGLVGIAGDKNYLPHYAIGSPEENGDQFPTRRPVTVAENFLVVKAKKLLAAGNPAAVFASRKLKPFLYKVFGNNEQVVRAGNWWGNDTCWRMALDLNRILLYANPDGMLRSTPKPYFSVVDGVVAMEGNGPVAGAPKPAGLLLAGSNAAVVDSVAAKIMGFDYSKLPLLRRSFDPHCLAIATGDPGEIHVLSNHPAWNKQLNAMLPQDALAFKPHFGWTGKIELDPILHEISV